MKLSGSGTIWAYESSTDFDLQVPYTLSVNSGKAKINVFTYPQHRGKGIATKVMTALLSEAKLLGVAAVDLMATEKGKPLYENLGFRVSNYTSMNKFL